MMKISDKVYATTEYFEPNVGYIRTGDGPVLVDSPFLPHESMDWYKKIIETEKMEIACLINTDHHFDHMMGNCFLTRNTIAHKLAVKGFQYYRNQKNLFKDIEYFFPEKLNDQDSGFEQVEIVTPRFVFNDELTLYYGGTEIKLQYVGGHSLATILIYVPSEKVLFAGDNIENNRHPAMGACKFDRWISLLKDMEKMDIDVVVPGHGEIGGKELVTKQIEYFEEMVAVVTDLKYRRIKKDDAMDLTADHMLAYMPVTEGEISPEINRDIIMTGTGKLYDEMR